MLQSSDAGFSMRISSDEPIAAEYFKDNAAPTEPADLRQPGIGGLVAVVEGREILQEFLSHCLRLAFPPPVRVECFSTVNELVRSDEIKTYSLLVLSLIGADLNRHIELISQCKSRPRGHSPVAVLSDLKDPESIVALLSAGVKGLVSTDLSMNVAIPALRLVRAGGEFFPTATLVASHSSSARQPMRAFGNVSPFTARQVAIIEALRKGKANKIIAYELNMCESTVKVHVRNIMKKLHAKNRTEVAFLTSELVHKSAAALPNPSID